MHRCTQGSLPTMIYPNNLGASENNEREGRLRNVVVITKIIESLEDFLIVLYYKYGRLGSFGDGRAG